MAFEVTSAHGADHPDDLVEMTTRRIGEKGPDRASFPQRRPRRLARGPHVQMSTPNVSFEQLDMAARTHAKGEQWSSLWQHPLPTTTLFNLDPMERIALVRRGVPAGLVTTLAGEMAIPKTRLYEITGVARPTIERKVSSGQLLSQEESERVLALARLIGHVQTIVEQSGSAKHFDASKWVAAWLDRPHPALDDTRPGDLMDTADGRALVASLVAQMQSGAYA